MVLHDLHDCRFRFVLLFRNLRGHPGDNGFLERTCFLFLQLHSGDLHYILLNRLIVLLFSKWRVPLVSCPVGGLGGSGFIS